MSVGLLKLELYYASQLVLLLKTYLHDSPYLLQNEIITSAYLMKQTHYIWKKVRFSKFSR